MMCNRGMSDADLIEKLGGPLGVLELLKWPRSKYSRVANWKTRGIPAEVKLAHPDVFCAPRPRSSRKGMPKALAGVTG